MEIIELHVNMWDLYHPTPTSPNGHTRYTFQVDHMTTVSGLKKYMGSLLSYLPEHLDVLLSRDAPYPLADKMLLCSLLTTHRELVIQPCGPMIRSQAPYLTMVYRYTENHDIKDLNGEVESCVSALDLRTMAAVDFPYLQTWIQTTPVQEILLSSDHPRIDDILHLLTIAIDPNKSLPNPMKGYHTWPDIKRIYLQRTHPTHHHPILTRSALTTFYHAIREGMNDVRLRIVIAPFVLGNEQELDLGEWVDGF